MRDATSNHRRVLVTGMLLAVSIFVGKRIESAEPADPTPIPNSPLKFRRVYVPVDRIKELARETFPKKLDEFEQFVRQMESAGKTRASGAVIDRAEYSARLDQFQLVGGEARLDVALRASEAAAIFLDDSRLAIAGPTWDAPQPRAATLAMTPEGRSVLLVEKSGRLKFSWSLKGAARVLGGVEFDLALPPCASNRLLLDIPSGLTPVVDAGLVVPAKSGNDGAAAGPTLLRTWTIELGGNTRVSLRLVPEKSLTRQQQLVLLGESLNYSLSPNGLAFAADLRLSVYHEPLRRLILRPEAGLHLTSARFRDRPLSISTISGANGQTQVVVEFPEPILGSDRQVQFTGVGPIVTGTKWRLPRLRVEGTVWQEGTTAVAVLEPLILQDVAADQGRQAKSKSLPASSAGEMLEFQSFGIDGAISVQVVKPPSRIKLLAGTSITFGSAAVAGVMKADITSLQGERFELICDLTRSWVIDSVETEPAAFLDDWSVVAADARRQQVRLRLKKPLDARQPARVVIRAHRQPTVQSTPLSVDQLRLAEFQDVEEVRHLVLARAEPPHRVEVSGDSELVRLDPAKLSPVEADLLERDTTGLLFQDGPGASRLQLSLESERASFSADALVDAIIDGESLTEEYRIRCRPELSRLSRILVHVSQAREPELAWSIPGQDERGFTTRRLSEEEQRGMGLIGGETWELVFLRPRGEPFEARGQRTIPLNGKTPLSLAWLPEAESQTGELAIASADGTCPTIEGQSLHPLSTRRPSTNRYTNVRAVYRYEPAQEKPVSVAPAAPGNKQSLAWAWNCQLTSRYSGGQASHSARYLLENLGRGQIGVTLPEGTTLEQVLVNEVEIPPPALSGADRKCVVPLPSGVRYPTVTLSFTSKSVAISHWGASDLSPVIPQADFPVLERNWMLWIPRDLELLERVGSGDVPAAARLAGGDRLFGPLRASVASRRFNPFNSAAWRDLAIGWLVEATDADQERSLRLLGTLASSGGSMFAWEDLLKQYSESAEQEGEPALPHLRIDQEGLLAAGIGPKSKVPTVRESEPIATGTEILAAANLRLIKRGDEFVLTSVQLYPGGANDEVAVPAVSIGQWIAGDELPTAPWSNLPQPPYAAIGTAQWTAQSFEVPSSGQLSVRVFRPQSVQAVAWGVLFVVAVVAWMVAAKGPRWLIPLAIGTGLFALFADNLFAPLGTAAFLGVLLGGLLLLAWRVGRRRPTWIEDVSTRTMLGSAPTPVMLAILGVLVTSLAVALTVCAIAADPPPRTDKVESSLIFPVYIPIDEKRQPTTGYVHMPPSLYEALERAAAAGTPVRSWLLQSAVYQCQLERAAVGGKLSVADLTAKFDLETLQAKTRVSLPLRRAGVHLFADRARLDGQPLQVEWVDDGNRLEFEVEAVGKHVLDLAFQPTLESDATFTWFGMTVPRLSRARFRVAAPLGAENISTPRAFGATDVDVETGELSIEIGPTDNLSLRWPALGSGASRVADLDADQQLWLKIRPGSVVVDGKFKFSQSEGLLREVRLVTDPRWRLLPPRADQPIAKYRIDEGESHTIHFELKPPYTSEASLNLSFLLSGASGVGNIVLPQLEAVGDRTSRRWLGVTLDPDLAGEFPAVGADTTIAPAEFLRNWGKGVGPAPLVEPQAAYRLPRGDVSWSIATRPKQPQVSGTAQLDVSFGARSASMQWNADLTTLGGSLFQHRLEIPPELEIESVSVLQGAVERVARWSRGSRVSATVFLNGPMNGEQRLIVRGTLVKLKPGVWEVPRLGIVDALVETEEVRVYQRPETLAIVKSAPGYAADSAAPLGEHRDKFGRLAASLRVESSGENAANPPKPKGFLPIIVATETNRPQVDCRLITTMLRTENTWTTDVECRLAIDSGTVDAVRLDVPMEFSGPYELDSPADVQVVEVPGQGRRRLLIRPAASLSGVSVLRLRGPLTAATQGRVAAPDIAPLDMHKVERFIVLPMQVEAQQIAWESSGLQAAPLPPEVRDRFPAGDSIAAYQVIGTSFQAAIKRVERVSGVPQVRLADIYVAWRPDGSCHGVALFDLEPAGLRHCLLSLPSHLELVHADVAELPALLSNAGHKTWKIELGPDQMPQRISVAFQGGVPHEGSPPARLRFAAPSLKNIPVKRTLWTIHAPYEESRGRMSVGDGETDALRQEVLRYTSTAALVERAADLVLENSAKEAADWYAPWADRLASTRSAIDVLRLEASTPALASAEIASVNRQQVALAARLKTSRPSLSGERPAAGWRQIFESVEPARFETVRCEFSGAQSNIHVTYTHVVASDFSARLAAAAGLLAVALVLYLLAAGGILGEWLARWPHACGAAAGIVWWLFLTPSFLGLVFVAASLFGAFRSPWKTSRTRPDPLTSRSGIPRPVAR